jgi:hypothetical protein
MVIPESTDLTDLTGLEAAPLAVAADGHSFPVQLNVSVPPPYARMSGCAFSVKEKAAA